jgi:predicted Zn-dependent protease with MMP-like domain
MILLKNGRRTIYHEVTHHFGFNEKETRELEKIFYEKHRNNK